MTINSNTFINTINTRLANTTLANTDIDNAITSVKTLNSINSVNVVTTLSNLPSALLSKGRMIYVTDVAKYYYSDGASWITDFTPKNIDYYTLWGAGDNAAGSLGINSTNANNPSPVSIVGGFTDWCQVSVKTNVSGGIRTNGTLWTWGCNSGGALGNGTTTNRSSPASVVGGFTDWCQVSAGPYHGVGLRTNGTIWAWGTASNGRLGNNDSITNHSSPVSVVGGFTDWIYVSAGAFHNHAIRSNGTLWSWGSNSAGAGTLGVNCKDVELAAVSSPVSVVGGFTDWCQVSAGGSQHSLAVRQNGTLWAWGSNSSLAPGVLGDGTTISRSSPVSVVGGFTDWCQASAGQYHSAAVRQNGTLWTWGVGSGGRLGNNSVVGRSSPVSVVGGFTDWCQVAAGSIHTAALKTDGSLWTWGDNSGVGALGNPSVPTTGSGDTRSSPISFGLTTGTFTRWCQVSASAKTIAVLIDTCR